MATFKNDPLSYKVIGCALVYKTLGPGLLEKVYQKALMKELELKGLKAEMEVPVNIIYNSMYPIHQIIHIKVYQKSNLLSRKF